MSGAVRVVKSKTGLSIGIQTNTGLRAVSERSLSSPNFGEKLASGLRGGRRTGAEKRKKKDLFSPSPPIPPRFYLYFA